MLLNNGWVKNQIKEGIKKFFQTNKNEHNSPKPVVHSEGSPVREVHCDTVLPKKDRNISNKQANPIPTRTRGTRRKTTESKYKEGNNQDQIRIK